MVAKVVSIVDESKAVEVTYENFVVISNKATDPEVVMVVDIKLVMEEVS